MALAPSACACSTISSHGDVLGLAQLLLVGGGAAADDVADAGEDVAEDVGAEDRLAGDEPEVAP